MENVFLTEDELLDQAYEIMDKIRDNYESEHGPMKAMMGEDSPLYEDLVNAVSRRADLIGDLLLRKVPEEEILQIFKKPIPEDEDGFRTFLEVDTNLYEQFSRPVVIQLKQEEQPVEEAKPVVKEKPVEDRSGEENSKIDRRKLRRYAKYTDEELFNAKVRYKKRVIIKLIFCFVGWTLFCLGLLVNGGEMALALCPFGLLLMGGPSVPMAFKLGGGFGAIFSGLSADIRTYDVYPDGHKVETTTVGDTFGAKLLALVIIPIIWLLMSIVITPITLFFEALKYFKLASAFKDKERWIILGLCCGALLYAIIMFFVSVGVFVNSYATANASASSSSDVGESSYL